VVEVAKVQCLLDRAKAGVVPILVHNSQVEANSLNLIINNLHKLQNKEGLENQLILMHSRLSLHSEIKLKKRLKIEIK
jgi:hypothetical protein